MEPPAYINEVIWEQQCQRFFRALQSPHSFILRSPDDPSKSIAWDYPGGTGQIWTRLQAIMKDRTSGHLKPVSTTVPTPDSLVYQLGPLDFLKMMIGISMEHDGSIAGFERIQCWVRIEGLDSHSFETRPWILIFVVPEKSGSILQATVIWEFLELQGQTIRPGVVAKGWDY